MATALANNEIGILNKVIPQLKFYDDFVLNSTIREVLNEDKEAVMSANNINDIDYESWQKQAVKSISNYLKEEGFVHARDEAKYYLSEKGKNLKQQGSLEKYEAWLKVVRAKNHKELHLIETRGYLDQDELIRNRKAKRSIQKSVAVWFVAVALVILLVAGMEHRYKFIENNPTLNHLFHNDKG